MALCQQSVATCNAVAEQRPPPISVQPKTTRAQSQPTSHASEMLLAVSLAEECTSARRSSQMLLNTCLGNHEGWGVGRA